MPDRITALASSLVAAVLVGAGLMAAGSDPATAADCLRAPNREISARGHWQYRLDRQDHRKCWYLADIAHKRDEARSARPLLSTKQHSSRAAERIPQSNADARAEIPELAYTEPFMDGPLRMSPEEPVPRGGRALWNPAPVEREPAMTSALTGAAPQLPPSGVDSEPAATSAFTRTAAQALPSTVSHEAAAQLPADEPVMPTLRLTLSLLLVAMGLGAVTGAVVFKRSDPVSAQLNDDPFHLRNMADEPEETLQQMTSDEMTSLALAEDIPLFLVRGWVGAD
jgi:hypothetical protein